MKDSFVDYYQILGVKKSADFDEIKSAYRTKAKLLHPDINQDSNSEDEFKLLNEAYSVLSSDKRKDYDLEYIRYQSQFEKNKRTSRTPRVNMDNRNRTHYQRSTKAYAAYSRGEHAYNRVNKDSFTDEFEHILNKIKNIYEEVRWEEEKEGDFTYRHKVINREYNHFYVKYVDTIPKEIAFYIGKGYVHVSGEVRYQTSKLSYNNKEPMSKYLIRNRGIVYLVAGALLLGGLGSATLGVEEVPAEEPISFYFDEDDNYVETITLNRNYQVQNGDSLYGLANQANVEIEDIQEANNTTSNRLYIGDKIIIPYIVNAEDLDYYTQVVDVDNKSIQEIAEEYETDVDTIVRLNKEAVVKLDSNYGILSSSLVIPKFITIDEYKQLKGGNYKVLS